MTNRNSKTHCLVDANAWRPKSKMTKRKNKAKAHAEGRTNWKNPLHMLTAKVTKKTTAKKAAPKKTTAKKETAKAA